MSSLPRQILQTVEVLPTEDQYQVLSFVESFWKKRQEAITTSLETNSGVAELRYESVRNRHFLKLQIMN